MSFSLLPYGWPLVGNLSAYIYIEKYTYDWPNSASCLLFPSTYLVMRFCSVL